MDSQQSNAHNPDSVQPFRTEYPYHPAPSEQFNYLNQDSENSFNTIWDAGRYTPDNQEPINGFNTPSQHWPHGALQSSNYTTPNYNVTHRPYDQTFSRIPDNYDIPPNFVSHSQQTSTASAFDPRSNSYTQVPPNITPQFNYNGQRLYQAQQAQSQTISPQALQHYPTHNSQAVPHKARQVSHLSILTMPLLESICSYNITASTDSGGSCIKQLWASQQRKRASTAYR